jgi:hypothetical protein
MRKYNLKYAVIVYTIWCIMSYFIASFYSWQFNPGLWKLDYRDTMVVFGPIFGVFVFLTVFFWEEMFKEESPGNE